MFLHNSSFKKKKKKSGNIFISILPAYLQWDLADIIEEN